MGLIDRRAMMHQTEEGQPDDIELLQTDVMRFLALLAICLMVIFSLVHALPLSSEKLPPRLADQLRAEIAELEQRLAYLANEQKALRAELDKDTRALEGARQEKTALNEELVRIREAVQAEKRRLDGIRAEAEARDKEKSFQTEELGRLQTEISEGQKALEAIEREIRRLQVAAKVKPGPQQPKPQGFSVIFESDQALTELVGQKRIGFYARVKDRFWQLSLERDHSMRFSEFYGKKNLWRLLSDTVPPSVQEAFARKVASYKEDSVTYYVDLPADITGRIRSEQAKAQGGTLVITSSGEVVLRQ